MAKLPLVAEAEVDRRLPGTLVVRIAERTPVALVAGASGLRAVDTAGTILPIDPVVSTVDAPVVSRARAARDVTGDKRLFAFLGALRAQNPELFDHIES
nr:FtsQ-type POTRA domain-containing protein [Gemmatimonadaceae bacterium]